MPVIVDAAAMLPPAENLTRYVDMGADMVSFSGGKGVLGPQSTGILAGRADLIEAQTPRHFARPNQPGEIDDAEQNYGMGYVVFENSDHRSIAKVAPAWAPCLGLSYRSKR